MSICKTVFTQLQIEKKKNLSSNKTIQSELTMLMLWTQTHNVIPSYPFSLKQKLSGGKGYVPACEAAVSCFW